MTFAVGSILLGMALLIVVILFVTRPLLMAKPAEDSRASERRSLEQQKEALLNEIRELDFDHETGKVPSDVYEVQRAHLMAQAAIVLQALDEMADESTEELRHQIEAVVAQHRQKAQPSSVTNGQGSFCTNCGRHLDQGDKFCAGCGQAVRVAQPSI